MNRHYLRSDTILLTLDKRIRNLMSISKQIQNDVKTRNVEKPPVAVSDYAQICRHFHAHNAKRLLEIECVLSSLYGEEAFQERRTALPTDVSIRKSRPHSSADSGHDFVEMADLALIHPLMQSNFLDHWSEVNENDLTTESSLSKSCVTVSGIFPSWDTSVLDAKSSSSSFHECTPPRGDVSQPYPPVHTHTPLYLHFNTEILSYSPKRAEIPLLRSDASTCTKIMTTSNLRNNSNQLIPYNDTCDFDDSLSQDDIDDVTLERSLDSTMISDRKRQEQSMNVTLERSLVSTIIEDRSWLQPTMEQNVQYMDKSCMDHRSVIPSIPKSTSASFKSLTKSSVCQSHSFEHMGNIILTNISADEYDAAPRLVKMQVTFIEVNDAIDCLKTHFSITVLSTLEPCEQGYVLSEQAANNTLSSLFDEYKRRSILMSLCHFRKLIMRLPTSSSGKVFIIPKEKKYAQ